MENKNNTTENVSNDFFSSMYNNNKRKIILSLSSILIFLIGMFFLNDKSVKEGDIVKKDNTTSLEYTLEQFIETSNVSFLKDTFNDVNTIIVWIYPPGNAHEWKIGLIELPQEVQKYRELGNSWHIENVKFRDAFDNQNTHVEIRFTNNN